MRNLFLGHWDLPGHECESWTNSENCKVIIQGIHFLHLLKNRTGIVSCAVILAWQYLFHLLQTYIDCLHIKKADKSRMASEDLMEVESRLGGNVDDLSFDEAKVWSFGVFQSNVSWPFLNCPHVLDWNAGGRVERALQKAWYIWQINQVIGTKYLGAWWCKEGPSLPGIFHNSTCTFSSLILMVDSSLCSSLVGVLWNCHLVQAFEEILTYFLLVILELASLSCSNTYINYLPVAFTPVEGVALLLVWLLMLPKILKLGKPYDPIAF